MIVTMMVVVVAMRLETGRGGEARVEKKVHRKTNNGHVNKRWQTRRCQRGNTHSLSVLGVISKHPIISKSIVIITIR